jgi:hypothetical protein
LLDGFALTDTSRVGTTTGSIQARQDALPPSGGGNSVVPLTRESEETLASGTDFEQEPELLDADAAFIVFDDLTLPLPTEMLSATDIALGLLTGSRPRAEVLPQQGSSVASVPTLLTTEAGTAAGVQIPQEPDIDLSHLLINPVREPLGQKRPADSPKAAPAATMAPTKVGAPVFLSVATLGLHWRQAKERRRWGRPHRPNERRTSDARG